MIPQYSPMIPTLGPEPFHRPGWIYEENVDGWRILAHKDGRSPAQPERRRPRAS